MLYQYLIMCKYLYNAYATERLCHTGTLWYDVQIHSNVTCRLSLPVMTYVMICKYLDVTRTCRLCHTRYLLIRKYIFYYVQLLVQYVLLADDTCIICYVQIMPNLMMYNYYMHIIIHFLLYFLRADYAGVLEVWPLQAANLRVPGPHVRGFQHHLTAPVHGVGPFLKVD